MLLFHSQKPKLSYDGLGFLYLCNPFTLQSSYRDIHGAEFFKLLIRC